MAHLCQWADEPYQRPAPARPPTAVRGLSNVASNDEQAMDTSGDDLYAMPPFPTAYPQVLDEEIAHSNMTGDEVQEAAFALTQLSAPHARDGGRDEYPHFHGEVNSL